MNKKIKILFTLPFMNAGGAEKIVCTLLKNLDGERFEPVLLLLEKKGAFLNRVPPEIEIYDLKSPSLKSSFFKLFNAIKEIDPDIVFSTIGSMNLLVSSVIGFMPRKIKFVARETNLVSLKNRDEKYPLLFDLMFKSVYKKFDLVICQSRDMFEDLRDNYRMPISKMKIIHNPVDKKEIEERASCGGNEKLFDERFFNVVAVGSLSFKKGFDLLIKSLFLCDRDDIFLTLIGEGKEKERLKRLVRVLSLENRVVFSGFRENPYPYMKNADLLALSSRYEGFPNVLLEANALGVPVLAFSCKGGINEIVKEGINGFVAESFDISEFAQKLEKAADFPFDGEKIKKSVERYELSKIIDEYEKVFENLYEERA